MSDAIIAGIIVALPTVALVAIGIYSVIPKKVEEHVEKAVKEKVLPEIKK